MPFDKTLPTDSTKIRNYPTVLTNNFAGIQEGDLTFKMWQLNFADRDLVAGAPPPAQDPTRDDDTMIMFSKQDAVNAETELFLMDDQTSTIQLSEGGKIGSRTTQAVFQDVAFGTSTFVNDQNSLVWAYGTIPAGGGAVAGGVGLGTATLSTVTGDALTYTVPLTRTPTNTNYIVIATAVSTRPGQDNVRLVNLKTGSKTTAQFQLRMQRNSSSANVSDSSIQVLVIGGF